ncbi:MAG TPA: hypothetical protein VNE39_17120 [Planctomycetota bacterium]|nr:hypothetical protein [Planctomycetota bacterium]
MRTPLACVVTLLASAALVAGEGVGKAAPATELGQLAASMKPGELKELKTRNYDWELLKSYYDWEENLRGAHKGYSIISWSNDANWDPVTRQLLYFGLGHYASPKFVIYFADTNEWKLMPIPPWADKRRPEVKAWPVGHTYDIEGICPAKRWFAVKWNALHLYGIDKGEWSAVPGFGTKGSIDQMEYFPELNGFVYGEGWGKKLMLYDVDTGEKRKLADVAVAMHGVMEYDPVHKVLILGGGDAGDKPAQDLYLLDREGKLTKLKPPPVWMRCTPECKVTCDPVSGDYLMKGRGHEDFYAFHPLKDEWKELPPALRVPDGLAAQVSTYGVVMFCGSGRSPRVLVYKHKTPWQQE